MVKFKHQPGCDACGPVNPCEACEDGTRPNKITVEISGFPDTLILSRGIYNCFTATQQRDYHPGCDPVPPTAPAFYRCVVTGLSSFVNDTFETSGELAVDGNGACNISGTSQMLTTGTIQYAPHQPSTVDPETGNVTICPGTWVDCATVDVEVNVFWDFGSINIQVFTEESEVAPSVFRAFSGGVQIELEIITTFPLKYNYCTPQTGSVVVEIFTTALYFTGPFTICDQREFCGTDVSYTVNYEVTPGFPP
jgi:hypothetical protein